MTTTLTANQIKFCEWLYKAGHTDPNRLVFDRSYLRALSMQNGMAWAPAWIVKDKTRVTGRGLYSIPELGVYINSLPPATAGVP